MKKTTRHALLLAALLVPASFALGQYRIDNGQARDANNRIGSGGFNAATQLNGRINGLAGNYIVTGNVTGGRAFRGSLGYTDSTSFRGSLGSAQFDSFVRDSIGVSQMRGFSGAGPNVATLGSQPFFGQSSVAPPSGFARDPNTGAFYLQPNRPGVINGDGRLDYGGATRSDIQQGVLSSQRVIGGPGLTQTPFASLNQREQLTRMSDFTAIARPPIDDVNLTTGSTETEGLRGSGLPQTDPQQQGQPAQTGVDQQGDTEASPSLTGQGTVYRNLRALDNNSQYAELRKRFDEKQQPRLPGSEAVDSLNKVNADLLAQRRKAEEAAKAGKADDTSRDRRDATQADGTGTGGAATVDEQNKIPPPPEDRLNLPRPANEPAVAPPSAPLEISSLAAGVKDAQLSKVLGEAEAAMKQGKFSTAIDAFDRAEEMAADDPLVFMGRSIAELGGGYYRAAEVHFRQAFEADPALLLAKFDLRGMLTDQRLEALQSDLAQIARKNTKDPGSLLLLAFIYYNTGFPERSERALEMVQERAGGKDTSAQMLKDAWFPAKPAATEQNK